MHFDGFRRIQPDLVAFQEAVVRDGYDQVMDILGTGHHVAGVVAELSAQTWSRRSLP